MKVGSMQDYFVLTRQISNVTVMLNNTGKSPNLEYSPLFNDLLLYKKMLHRFITLRRQLHIEVNSNLTSIIIYNLKYKEPKTCIVVMASKTYIVADSI